MPGKIPVSTRLSQDDADYLANLKVDGAVTPSDKLRAVIKEARQRDRGTEDYPGSLRMAMETLAPTLRIIRASEYAAGQHSELMNRVADWVQESFAYVVACNDAKTLLTEDELMAVESGLAQRVFALMESVLQMGVTQRASCYDPEVIRKGIGSVLDIAEVIRKTKGGENV